MSPFFRATPSWPSWTYCSPRFWRNSGGAGRTGRRRSIWVIPAINTYSILVPVLRNSGCLLRTIKVPRRLTCIKKGPVVGCPLPKGPGDRNHSPRKCMVTSNPGMSASIRTTPGRVGFLMTRPPSRCPMSTSIPWKRRKKRRNIRRRRRSMRTKRANTRPRRRLRNCRWNRCMRMGLFTRVPRRSRECRRMGGESDGRMESEIRGLRYKIDIYFLEILRGFLWYLLRNLIAF